MTDSQFISLLFCIGFSTIWIVVAIKMAADEAVKKISLAIEMANEQNDPFARMVKSVTEKTCGNCEYFKWNKRDKPCCYCVDKSEFVRAED